MIRLNLSLPLKIKSNWTASSSMSPMMRPSPVQVEFGQTKSSKNWAKIKKRFEMFSKSFRQNFPQPLVRQLTRSLFSLIIFPLTLPSANFPPASAISSHSLKSFLFFSLAAVPEAAAPVITNDNFPISSSQVCRKLEIDSSECRFSKTKILHKQCNFGPWSVGQRARLLPSMTIWVRIPLKSTIFCKTVSEKNEIS